MYSRVIGTGSHLPERILSNYDLEKMVETSHDWIVSRTGIVERHIAAENEATSDLALQASRRAIESAGIDVDEIDLIIVATTTPDMLFPSTASILQSKLGIRNNCPAFDVQAVCTGFIYALATADCYLRSGKYRHALVVGAETLSRVIDWTDRATCVLFGDGAGAVVLRASETPGILSSHLHADGSHSHILAVPGRICDGKIQGSPFVTMNGHAVFKIAVNVLEKVATEALLANHMSPSDLDWLVPHQANIRIIEATSRKLGLGMDRVVVTVDRHGNTSAASIPLALDCAAKAGRFREGETLLMEGVGGGITWGALLLKW
ncbi:MAG: ketoacyl-ACP synthase III [Burkholderiales bacterium]|nr:ketoacyl-ACP synthase III [Burkholderiales bacterium]